MKQNNKSFIILIIAIATLIGLSLCPWNEWSGGRLKNFNLFSDILDIDTDASQIPTETNVDPELLKFMDEIEAEEDAPTIDTIPRKVIPVNYDVPRKNGIVLFEDYSFDGNGLNLLASTLEKASNRPVRIAMVGDSYIEGDILAQDIRSGLQTKYGGCGVGYTPIFTNFPGFRSSINQSCSGWEEHEYRKVSDERFKTIYGSYHTSQDGATTRYKKSLKLPNLDKWESTKLLFITDNGGQIKFTDDNKNTTSFTVAPSNEVQCVNFKAPVGDVSITTDITGLNVLGVWLEETSGIILDDISLRGNSGLSLRKLSSETTEQIRNYIDYDIIILEFGMNALSAAQSDYSAYAKGMIMAVNNLKSLYPNAQFIIMGVGDRAQKNGTNYESVPTIPNLIKAQREVANKTGSIFWDTREAMGGNGAAIDWHKRKLINADFIHLNHKGGSELAKIFLNSLELSLE